MPEKLFNPDYLKHLCSKYGLVPSKKYGQNFLIDEGPIAKMLEAAEITKEDMVVEIGPGFGVLTFALAEKAKKVTAFEIEKKLMPYWSGIFNCHSERVPPQRNDEESLSNKPMTEISHCVRNDKRGEIEIIWGNVLNEVESYKVESYKVVANLPYQITSEVIRKFLEIESKPTVMVFMVQKEVAERICAKPALPGEAGKRSRGEMSVLSVSVQLYAEPEIIMNVPRSSFWPEPKVDSAVIKIRIKKQNCHSETPLRGEESLSQSTDRDPSSAAGGLARDDNRCDDALFFKIVKAGFANRRKMLIKNLSSIITKDKLKTIFAEMGINEKVRAQELSVEQWRKLSYKVIKLSS